MTAQPSITCNETLAISAHRIFPDELNEHGTLFGGITLNIVDREASLAAMDVARQTVVTAKLDHVNFIAPFQLHNSMNLEAYVTGMGHRSIEVFAKIIGKDLTTGQTFLGFTCFATFVIEDQLAQVKYNRVIPQTEEQQAMCAGYEQRVQERRQERQLFQKQLDTITTNKPWQN